MRLDSTLQSTAPNVIVGRDDVEVSKLISLRQRLDAIIKLMIADRAGIIANQRHRLVLNLTSVEIEVRSALTNIAGVDQQRVRIFFTHPLDQSRTPRHAALAGVGFVVL